MFKEQGATIERQIKFLTVKKLIFEPSVLNLCLFELIDE